MPLRKLTSRSRSRTANVCLAAILAFAAGQVDVSGYLGLRQFTSHMSGTTASLAAGLGTNPLALLSKTMVVLLSFLCGAVACALLVNFSRRRDRESQFALPLLLESLLLLVAAILGNHHQSDLGVVGLLAFAMGLQNAIITKISDAEIRTTHVTGMVTDIGIEIGRALYWNRNQALEPVRVRPERLAILFLLVLAFFTGGMIAAAFFPHFRFSVVIPLAIFLGGLTILPIQTDLRFLRKHRAESA